MTPAAQDGGSRRRGDARIAVVGLGNVLMRDDALGPYVIGLLGARHDFPPGVSLEDLGTPGLDLHPHLEKPRALIVVDTVRTEGKAGELRLYRREEILRHAPGPKLGPHDPGLKETLLALEFAGAGPEQVLLVGVIPGDTGFGVGLTDDVRGALPAAEAAVLEELARLGHPARPAAEPREPDLWWEREAGGATP